MNFDRATIEALADQVVVRQTFIVNVDLTGDARYLGGQELADAIAALGFDTVTATPVYAPAARQGQVTLLPEHFGDTYTGTTT